MTFMKSTAIWKKILIGTIAFSLLTVVIISALPSDRAKADDELPPFAIQVLVGDDVYTETPQTITATVGDTLEIKVQIFNAENVSREVVVEEVEDTSLLSLSDSSQGTPLTLTPGATTLFKTIQLSSETPATHQYIFTVTDSSTQEEVSYTLNVVFQDITSDSSSSSSSTSSNDSSTETSDVSSLPESSTSSDNSIISDSTSTSDNSSPSITSSTSSAPREVDDETYYNELMIQLYYAQPGNQFAIDARHGYVPFFVLTAMRDKDVTVTFSSGADRFIIHGQMLQPLALGISYRFSDMIALGMFPEQKLNNYGGMTYSTGKPAPPPASSKPASSMPSSSSVSSEVSSAPVSEPPTPSSSTIISSEAPAPSGGQGSMTLLLVAGAALVGGLLVAVGIIIGQKRD